MNNKQAFIKGAAILLVANLIVKVIGAVFKIPLARLLGNEGMGIFTTAYSLFTWFFVIATAGLPIAVSKMVSESLARGNQRETKKILSASIFLMIFIGVTTGIIMYFGAEALANLFGNAQAAYAIKAISPTIIFVSLMAAFRGFFQGKQEMMPTAVSEVAEAIGKLVIGYTLAAVFIKTGIEYGAAGAIFGVGAGSVLGFFIILIIFLSKRKHIFSSMSGKSRGMFPIMKHLIAIAIPITVGASVFTITSFIDTAMIMRRLEFAGFDHRSALSMWGIYSGFAIPLFNMPASVIAAISISVVPAVAGAFTANNRYYAKKTTQSALRLTLLFSLPCAIGLSLLSEPILQLIYKNTNATSVLSLLGYAVVPVSMVLVTNAILQATGKTMVPVRNMLIGGLAKIIANYILVGSRGININGAPVGTNLCYIIILVLNLIAVKDEIGAEYNISDFVVRPLLSVAVMAVGLTYVYKSAAVLGNTAATLLAIMASVAIYSFMLFAVGAVKEEDILYLPKGNRLAAVLKKLKIVRR